MKKSVVLRRLLDELFDLFSEYKSGSCNLFYDARRGQLLLTASGSSIIEFGVIPAPTVKEEAKVPPVIVKLPEKKVALEGVLKDE